MQEERNDRPRVILSGGSVVLRYQGKIMKKRTPHSSNVYRPHDYVRLPQQVYGLVNKDISSEFLSTVHFRDYKRIVFPFCLKLDCISLKHM